MIDLGERQPRAGKNETSTGKYASFLLPIMTSIVVSAFFTFLIANTSFIVPIEFLPEAEGGIAAAAINAIILSMLPFLGGLMLLLVLKKRRRLLLKAIIGVAFLLSGFVIFLIIFASAVVMAFAAIQGETALMIAIPISLALNIVLVYVTLSSKPPQGAKNAAAVTYGGGIGTLLGTALPLWTGLLMVLGISIYDVYSVRSGPIKEIVKTSKEQEMDIPGLSYVSSDWEIGLGDLGIYSMLISLAETQFGLVVCMASIVGILIGSLLTLQLLKKKEYLPGLPLTSLVGAIPIVIFMILS